MTVKLDSYNIMKKKSCIRRHVTFRKCFILFIFFTFALFVLIQELDKILHCEKDKTGEFVRTPKGKYIQKIGKFSGLKPYKNLSSICRYKTSGKIECPDVRMQGETLLRQIQLVLIRILLIIDLICKKHNIKYWLASGTLLGAIRDKGFIPWDNDADIAMLDSDYQRFLTVVVNELPKDLFFQTKETDANFGVYQKNEAKIRDRLSCTGLCLRYGCRYHDGLFLDIFVLKETDKQGEYKNKWNRFHYKKSDIFPLRRVLFDGFLLPIPQKYEEILKHDYGDYTRPPNDRKLCPSKGYIGHPWYSCEFIAQQKKRKKQRLIQESRISDDWILYYTF